MQLSQATLNPPAGRAAAVVVVPIKEHLTGILGATAIIRYEKNWFLFHDMLLIGNGGGQKSTAASQPTLAPGATGYEDPAIPRRLPAIVIIAAVRRHARIVAVITAARQPNYSSWIH
jgi:hypothetical protein